MRTTFTPRFSGSLLRSWRVTAAVLALGATIGCLAGPEFKDCTEFPLGTEGCPEDCALYCRAMMDACPDVFETEGRCLNDCANEPVVQLSEGAFGDDSGNSLACRLTYLRRDQCVEASLEETTACVGASCEDYCDLMLEHCEGAYASNDRSNCLQSCAMLPRAADDSDQNSVECRYKYALQAASSEDQEACDPAGFSGGGVCGQVCDTYCDVVMMNCVGESAIYEDRAQCEEVCATMNTEGRYDDWAYTGGGRDSVQCRLWHAGPPSVNDPTFHCKHTRVYNEEFCPSAGDPPPADWPCPTYCRLVARNCPDVYPDRETCLDECKRLPELDRVGPEGPALFPATTRECPTR